MTGNDVNYWGVDCIELKDNFEVQPGAEFLADFKPYGKEAHRCLVKDHKQNVRTLHDDEGAVIEHIDYYPFNLRWDYDDSPAYDRNLEGAIEQVGIAKHIDVMGYRTCDRTTGRFSGVDPLAERGPQYSPYIYTFNNPIRYTDPDGRWPIETIWDIGNVIYDAGAAIVDHIKGDHAAARGHWGDFAADGAAVLIPYVPAGASKLRHADEAVDLINGSDKAVDAGKADDAVDYIGFPDGTTVHKSQSKMEESLKGAGFNSKDLKNADGTVKGRQYDLDDVNARAMEPSGTNPRRTSFENKNGQPSQPGGTQVKTHDTKGMTKSQRKEAVRQRTHAIQNQ